MELYSREQRPQDIERPGLQHRAIHGVPIPVARDKDPALARVARGHARRFGRDVVQVYRFGGVLIFQGAQLIKPGASISQDPGLQASDRARTCDPVQRQAGTRDNGQGEREIIPPLTATPCGQARPVNRAAPPAKGRTLAGRRPSCSGQQPGRRGSPVRRPRPVCGPSGSPGR